MRSLCIIPARGGSKRIPKKNIKPFCGKPIIEYSIELARASKLFNEVAVTTDSREIEDLVEINYPSVLRLKRYETAADDAPLIDVVLEVLATYACDALCLLYATAPFVTEEKLKLGQQILSTNNYAVVYPIVKNNFHIEQTLVLHNERVRMLWNQYNNKNLHQGITTYKHASQWFWINAEKIKNAKTLTPPDAGYVLLKEHEYCDIDTPEDWETAERKYRAMQELSRCV